ncbi:MAG: hypothetical protein LBF22_03455 [Deltaproteobacteria bacterium]|nr:hypothetical protein [Deltaproteobacteria bacterium]
MKKLYLSTSCRGFSFLDFVIFLDIQTIQSSYDRLQGLLTPSDKTFTLLITRLSW